MKVETPQILWHAEEKNLPAALLSIDMHESGNVFATAGNGIHLWDSSSRGFLTSLNRHGAPVNRIAFYENYLASAGDTGDIILFHSDDWKAVASESDVKYIPVGRAGEAVTDLAWSGDGRRLVVCTIDHNVVVVEKETPDHESTFRIVFSSSNWHSHYVQGVTYDPLNLYICTSSSDRTVRIAQARHVKKKLHIGKTKQIKGRFVDEGSLKSFCRRLAWTPDGGYLIVPAANAVEDTYATLLYARHRFDEPARILGGLEKVGVMSCRFIRLLTTIICIQPSICVRPNPILFKVPDDSKENASQHRCVFCVLTWDSVIVYDTHHDHPLAVVTGIHYSNLVDAAWTPDGMKLFVCSTDGFITFIDFADGELGEPLPKETTTTDVSSCALASLKIQNTPAATTPTLPPCEPGMIAVHAPPTKRAKLENSKRNAVENLDEAKKKKKRVAPTLVGRMG